MNFTATSFDAALTIGSAFIQHYNGTFSIIGAGNVNELSGTFSDAAFGTSTGGQLSINVASPPDSLTLTSDVINAADLTLPGSFTLSMSNIASPPGLHLDGTTIAAFDASFAGVANATTVAASEPASLGILGLGLFGLGMVAHRRRSY
jgi:MYXO-CTERM domain-containing protein